MKINNTISVVIFRFNFCFSIFKFVNSTAKSTAYEEIYADVSFCVSNAYWIK